MNTQTQRLIPDRAFPPYAFVPGLNPHPFKEGGHGFGHERETNPLKAHEVIPLRECPDFLYAIDLFNGGFYWESHVYGEALWNAFKRQGPIADALKGLIKLAAAGIKARQGALAASAGHADRALELLGSEEVLAEGELAMLDLPALAHELARPGRDVLTLKIAVRKSNQSA